MRTIFTAMLSLFILLQVVEAKEVTIEQKIQGLYVAFFKRAADQNGLKEWKKKANNSANSSAILDELSKGFAGHPTFDATYSEMSNREFVEAIYINALGKDGDEEGIKNWLAKLDDGMSRSNMISKFVEASLTLDITAENFPTFSAEELEVAQKRQALITNKVNIAINFTNSLASNTNVVNASSPDKDPAYLASIQIISEVTEDEESVNLAKNFIKTLEDDNKPIEKILIKQKEDEIIKLYVGTFNKVPTKDEIIHSLAKIDNDGWNMAKIGNSFFEESKAKYPDSLTNKEFIEKIHLNVFNRALIESDMNHWLPQLDDNKISRQDLILAILTNAKGDDKAILVNKKNIGRYFAINLGLSDQTLAVRALSAVNKHGSSAAIVNKTLLAYAVDSGKIASTGDKTAIVGDWKEFFGKNDNGWNSDEIFFAKNDFFDDSFKGDYARDVFDPSFLIALNSEGFWAQLGEMEQNETEEPQTTKEIPMCNNKSAYIRESFSLGMELTAQNTDSIAGRVFSQSKSFVGVAFSGTFTNVSSSSDVLNKLKAGFSSAINITYKNNVDGSLKAQYELNDKNIQSYALLKDVLKKAGANDFSNYIDYTTFSAIKDLYIDLYIKYENANCIYVILAITDKSKNNKDDLAELIDDGAINRKGADNSKTDEFTYKEAKLKSDILFVMDDSGSMREEQKAASDAITKTFEQAMKDNSVDWKATVIGTEEGRNYDKNIKNPSINNISKLSSQLKMGTRGWDEVGLKRAYNYLKNNKITVRKDSKLSIVYISDEVCHTELKELGITDINDSYFVKEGIKINVIIPENNRYAGRGTRANDLAYKAANITGGEVANLRNYKSGYDAMMQKISDDSAGQASKIILSEKNPIAPSIKVFADGVVIPTDRWNYNNANNSIVFIKSSLPKDGTIIKVTYKY